MDFDSYQHEAQQTDQQPTIHGNGMIVPLLGLVGETGSLLAEYKKLLRDGALHTHFYARVSEELGDLLWYIANLATKCNLKLSAIAIENLAKTKSRWTEAETEPMFFDQARGDDEQLPRSFRYSVGYVSDRVRLVDPEGNEYGARLSDNAYVDDGYRFHDVMHLAFTSVLGWSPVTRALLERKRKTAEKLDEVEDGGRAILIEEGVVAMAYDYAVDNGLLEGEEEPEWSNVRIDWELLRAISRITRRLEVGVRSEAEWERALLAGLKVWREVRGMDGGIVVGNGWNRTLESEPPQG